MAAPRQPACEARTVTVPVGPKPVDLYDTVAKRFVARRCKGRARLALPADRAAVLVLTPAGGKLQRQGDAVQALADGRHRSCVYSRHLESRQYRLHPLVKQRHGFALRQRFRREPLALPGHLQ